MGSRPADFKPASVTLRRPPAARHVMPTLHTSSSARELPADAARLLLDRDPGTWLVLVPAFEVATALRGAFAAELARRGGAAVLAAPRIATFESLIEAAAAGRPVTPHARRLADLRQVLAERGWFGGAPSWDACQAILELADELSARLPEAGDEAGFLRLIEAHYRGRATHLAEPEARLVYEVWRAYARPVRGAPLDPGIARRMLVDEAARACDRALLWLLPHPGARLGPEEAAFAKAVEARRPLHLLCPAGLPPALELAWPDEAREPLAVRAARLDGAGLETLSRIRILCASGLEAEAHAARHQVRRWLAEGRRAIALIAQDRAATRRVRALLERDGVLLADEAGWKLSTTRAATCAMRWVEAVAGGLDQRDLLDWLRSPFAFADLPRAYRDAGIAALDAAVRAHNVRGGIDPMRRAVARMAAPGDAARLLLERIEAAARPWSRRAAAPAEWFDLLVTTLDEVGALAALEADAAGAPLVDLLRSLTLQLAGGKPVELAVWRDFFAAELELASFRDTGIDSPVVVTSLKRAALRRFDAILLLGGGEAHLGTDQAPRVLFGERLRARLGLSTPGERARELRDDLAALICATDRFCVTWMAGAEREPQRLSSWFKRLDALARVAGGSLIEAVPAPPLHPAAPTRAAAPAPAAAALLPAAVSASAYASLVACPYRFFARHMLGLNEADEVREEFEKRDYGTWVHALLDRLHRQVPVLSALPRTAVLAQFRRLADEVFAEPVAFNFLSTGWKARLVGIADAYLDWQCAREAQGWRWQDGEIARDVAIPLASGTTLRLTGRLDRLDARGAGEAAILDYKTQSRERLKQKVAEPGEDVQLALYGLLYPAGTTAEAAYVALDGDEVGEVAANPDHSAAAEAARIATLFGAIEAGAPLPANAPESVCDWCEMRGLCRRDHWQAAEGGDA